MSSKARSDEPWTVARVTHWATADFEKRGLESARLDAELLLCHVLAVARIRLILEATRPLGEDELARYRALIQRRRAGVPVAYLLGAREFYGRPFRVDARALIPRADTEALVDVALSRTRARSLYGRALDLCTGSGCVALSLACERPTWRVTGSDLSADAVALALENSLRLGAVWGVRLVTGDLFAPLREGEKFELITANPPYIPSGDVDTLDAGVRDHEPRLALDGGDDGLSIVRRIVAEAPRWLTPGGVLAVELQWDQSERAEALFRAAGFVEIERRRDYGGNERVVSGVAK